MLQEDWAKKGQLQTERERYHEQFQPRPGGLAVKAFDFENMFHAVGMGASSCRVSVSLDS